MVTNDPFGIGNNSLAGFGYSNDTQRFTSQKCFNGVGTPSKQIDTIY